jgi:hypothetical protein
LVFEVRSGVNAVNAALRFGRGFAALGRIADLQSAERSKSNSRGSLLAQRRMEFCDTAD